VGQADATAQLTALGFHVVPVPVDDPTVDPGSVSRTDPPEGTPTTAGSTITIFVARQPIVPSSAPASVGPSASIR